MHVHHMVLYYPQHAHFQSNRNQAQWDAYKFCRAVKYRRINGSCSVPYLAGRETITERNVGRARSIFGRFIAHRISNHLGLNDPLLIPAPSKDGLIRASTFRSLEMLNESIIGHAAWTVAPIVRFSRKLTAASEGGPRGRYQIAPYLEVIKPLPSRPIVLIDDIVTSGGTLLACRDVLEAEGGKVVAAVVCGSTDTQSTDPPFGEYVRILRDQASLFD